MPRRTKYMSVQRIWDLSWLKGCFSHKLANLSWNFVTATRNVPKLPDVLRLLLRKTGHWPVHDIKSFASGMFLSSFLLKEQNYEDLWLKKKKKNLVRDDTKSKRDRKASGGFEHRIASLKKATFISSRYFCSCCYCTGSRSSSRLPPPPAAKIKNCHFLSLKTFVKPIAF